MTRDENLQRALTHLAGLQQPMMELTEKLVRINSHSANVAGVNAVGEVLQQAMDLPGLSLRRVDGSGCGDHLIWRNEAAKRSALQGSRIGRSRAGDR